MVISYYIKNNFSKMKDINFKLDWLIRYYFCELIKIIKSKLKLLLFLFVETRNLITKSRDRLLCEIKQTL